MVEPATGPEQPETPPARASETPPSTPGGTSGGPGQEDRSRQRRRGAAEGASAEKEGLVDALGDLLQTAADWVRQEAEATVRDKVALPLQRVGIAVASTGAAGCLVVVALLFIGIGSVWALGSWLGFPAAFLLIGGVYLLGAVIFIAIRAKVMLRDTGHEGRERKA